MSIMVGTGLVLESVIQEVSESDYGPLSDEFKQIVVETEKGKPFDEALLDFSNRAGSDRIKQVIEILIEASEPSASLSDKLMDVWEKMRGERRGVA